MSWYKTGTVTVTNGSAAVVGSGTTWLNVVAPGWGFVGPDGKVYEVLNVVSDTSLTLGRNYTGTTAAGASYDAYPTQGEIRDLAAQVLTLINDYALVRDNAGAGKFQTGSAGAPGVTTVGDLNTGMFWPAADSIGLATGGTERVRVTSTGNVGIGTATPLTPLDINHATDSRVRLMLAGSGVMQMQSVAGANRLASNTADPLELWTNGVRRVSIESGGSVGVGTATPSTYPGAGLVVAGSGEVNSWVVSGSPSNTSFRGLAIGVTGSSNVYGSVRMQLDAGELRVASGFSGYGGFQTFYTNGTEKVRIDAGGNVGVGAIPSAWVVGASAVELPTGSVGSLSGGPVNHAFISANAYATGSSDPAFATWKYAASGVAQLLEVGGANLLALRQAPSGLVDANIVWGDLMTLDTNGNLVHTAPAVAPALTASGQMVFNLTSNTNLRVSVRGTDGVTRVANLTLA